MKPEDKKRALQFLEMIDFEVEDGIDITHSGTPNMEMKISVWVDQLKAIIERSDCEYCNHPDCFTPLELLKKGKS